MSAIDSPCINVCKMDPDLGPDGGYCIGCWRSLPEIAGWSRMSDTERQAVLQQLPARRKEAA